MEALVEEELMDPDPATTAFSVVLLLFALDSPPEGLLALLF